MANSTLETRPLTTPNPDPTAATTAALLREITGSKELGDILVKYTREIMEAELKGARDVLQTRLDSIEGALNRVPTHSQENIKQLREIVDEKFKVQDEKFSSVETQFAERDVRSDKSEVAQKTAVDAALAGAEKAVGKTELSFTKQIDQIGQRIDTVSKSSDEKISDLKERIQAVESQKKGAGDMLGYVIGAVGMLLALGTFAILALRAAGKA